jgi:hypothetical protein
VPNVLNLFRDPAPSKFTEVIVDLNKIHKNHHEQLIFAGYRTMFSLIKVTKLQREKRSKRHLNFDHELLIMADAIKPKTNRTVPIFKFPMHAMQQTIEFVIDKSSPYETRA